MIRVLFVDSDEGLRNKIDKALTESNIHVTTVGSAEAAKEVLSKETPDFVLMDLMLGDDTGTSLAPTLHRAGIPYAYLSDYTEREAVQRFGKQVRERVLSKGPNGGLRMDLLTRIYDNVKQGVTL